MEDSKNRFSNDPQPSFALINRVRCYLQINYDRWCTMPHACAHQFSSVDMLIISMGMLGGCRMDGAISRWKYSALLPSGGLGDLSACFRDYNLPPVPLFSMTSTLMGLEGGWQPSLSMHPQNHLQRLPTGSHVSCLLHPYCNICVPSYCHLPEFRTLPPPPFVIPPPCDSVPLGGNGHLAQKA